MKPFKDLVDRLATIDLSQDPLTTIKSDDGLRVGPIRGQARTDRLLVIIRAALKLSTTEITDSVDTRWVRLNVKDSVAG